MLSIQDWSRPHANNARQTVFFEDIFSATSLVVQSRVPLIVAVYNCQRGRSNTPKASQNPRGSRNGCGRFQTPFVSLCFPRQKIPCICVHPKKKGLCIPCQRYTHYWKDWFNVWDANVAKGNVVGKPARPQWTPQTAGEDDEGASHAAQTSHASHVMPPPGIPSSGGCCQPRARPTQNW